MPNCPKCGTKIKEDYDYCPKCGTALKPAPAPAPPAPPYREEKHEKREKGEKQEKGEKAEKGEKYEKYERRELNYMAPLVGGLILIFLGLLFYVATQLPEIPRQVWVASFFVFIGIIVLIVGVYAVTTATRRSPKP